MRFLPDRFVLMMIGAVILALIIPGLGRPDGPLHLGVVTKIGIALIFFLHGAKLSPEKLATGVKLWKVHTLTQATTFILFPLLGALAYFALDGVLPDSLRLGFFFLSAVPSTVSSSVALTGMANGNVPVAVFNASLSGLIGLFLTPLIMAIVTITSSADFSILEAIKDIAQMLLLPFVIGQLARPWIGNFLERHASIVSGTDRSVILLIVFTSFAGSTHAGIWSAFSAFDLAFTTFIVLILLAIALILTTFLAKWFKLAAEDKTAAIFCGATKSLANGAPIAQILFAGTPDLGLIMLPLMLYHQLQLMVCATLAQRYARETTPETSSVS